MHPSPITTKAMLEHLSLRERARVPFAELDAIYVSSGTSGKPPLFSARAVQAGYEYRAQWLNSPNAFLSSIGPPHRQEYWLTHAGKPPRVVALDPKRMEASVKLAKAAGVDGMYVFVHLLPTLGELMKKHAIAQNIRYLEFAGESCSHALYAYMRDTFPHAEIFYSFGASEVETSPIAFACRRLGDDVRQEYHTNKGCNVELIDEAGKHVPIKTGAEGELVVTVTAHGAASILQRYRLGDRVRVVQEKCSEHGVWSFTPLGRTDMDFIKIAGGVLSAAEVERVLRMLGVPDRFELHLYEQPTGHGPTLRAELHIEHPESTSQEAIMAALRVSPTYTYAQGVAAGHYLPLVCKPLSPQGIKKHARLVRHW